VLKNGVQIEWCGWSYNADDLKFDALIKGKPVEMLEQKR